MIDNINFDMEAAIEALREGKDLSGKDGILTPLIKQLTEAARRLSLKSILTQTRRLIVKLASISPTRKVLTIG